MENKDAPLVLIVDDNHENIRVLGNVIEQEGYNVAVAMNGAEALEFVKNELPTAILLDIMMADMDGYEVCRRLKSSQKTKDIPVLFLTAKRGTEELVKGFEVGGVDYITKPFQRAELLARLKTHISLKRAYDEISVLRGILPICSNCKKIRDDNGYWSQLVCD